MTHIKPFVYFIVACLFVGVLSSVAAGPGFPLIEHFTGTFFWDADLDGYDLVLDEDGDSKLVLSRNGADDQLRFETGGAERLRLSDSDLDLRGTNLVTDGGTWTAAGALTTTGLSTLTGGALLGSDCDGDGYDFIVDQDGNSKLVGSRNGADDQIRIETGGAERARFSDAGLDLRGTALVLDGGTWSSSGALGTTGALSVYGQSVWLDQDQDTGIDASTDDVIDIATGGKRRLLLSTDSLISGVTIDFDGYSLLLDQDADSYIVSGAQYGGRSDDEIYFGVAGGDIATLTTNGLDFETAATISTTAGNLVVNSAGAIDIRDLVQIGDGTYVPGHAPTSLHVEGIVEFDGAAYFDTSVSSNAVWLSTGSISQYGGLKQSADDGLVWAIGDGNNSGNHNVIFTSVNNYAKDHDHDTQSANPTLYFHSALNPDTNNTRWGSLAHTGSAADGGSFVIATGAGIIELDPALPGVQLPRLEDAAPAAPMGCNATSRGTMMYVDDTDDTAYGQVCICSWLDGTGYDWRSLSDITGTACPFF